MGERLTDGLNYFIQYRGKRHPTAWRTMAAFDVIGAAETYYDAQQSDIWEYRLVEPDTEAQPDARALREKADG